MGHRDQDRLDDLRRFGVALASAVGIPPARASAFVSGLLWYDAAGASSFGIASLADWLAAIEAGEIDPKSEGTIARERPATAVLDGGRGLWPLILRRAAEIAVEKAREVGLGMVEVVNLGRSGPAGEAVSEIAVGPMIGSITGPGLFAMAMPVAGSVPMVVDSSLGRPAPRPDWGRIAPMPAVMEGRFGESGWTVSARAVDAFETLEGFHERIGRALQENPPTGWEVRPDDWQARRLDHIDRGLALDADARRALLACGERLGIAPPSAWGEV